MKYTLIISICCLYTQLISQHPYTIKSLRIVDTDTTYSSKKFYYNDGNQLIKQEEYNGFDFEKLYAETINEYRGGKLKLYHYRYFDSNGEAIRDKRIESEEKDEGCLLAMKVKSTFGLCHQNIDSTYNIEYIEGCENGWYDYINDFCFDYDFLTGWTRHSDKYGDYILLRDTLCFFLKTVRILSLLQGHLSKIN